MPHCVVLRLIGKGNHPGSLQYHGSHCGSSAWETTQGVYNERPPREFTMRDHPGSSQYHGSHCSSSAWQTTQGVYNIMGHTVAHLPERPPREFTISWFTLWLICLRDHPGSLQYHTVAHLPERPPREFGNLIDRWKIPEKCFSDTA